MKLRRRARAGALAGVAVCASAAVAACSLVNAFDDVKAAIDASTSDVATGDDATPDAPATDTFVPDAGNDVVDATPKGVIVVGGVQETDAGPQPVLTALAPEDGSELVPARTKMNVAGIFYDGLRDLWYVFESGGAGAFPLPNDVVTLHVRHLDSHTGQWDELLSRPVPTLVSFGLVTVLNQRLVYVAYESPDGGDAAVTAPVDLVTLDTSDPAAVKVVDEQRLAKQPIGVIGTRSTGGNGGVVNLLVTGPCEASGCVEMLVEHVEVPTNAAPVVSTPVPLRPYGGTPAYGSYFGQGSVPVDVIAASESFSSTTVTVASYSPQITGQYLTDGGSFGSLGQFWRPLAFADCMEQALFIETNQDLELYAFPLVPGGHVFPIQTGRSGQAVYFEPYTSTVLVPFSQGEAFALNAYTLGGTKTDPKLTPRSQPGWLPPIWLRPSFVAPRSPVPPLPCSNP